MKVTTQKEKSLVFRKKSEGAMHASFAKAKLGTKISAKKNKKRDVLLIIVI